MKFYNLKRHTENVTFVEAVKQGFGTQQGLFFPLELPEFDFSDINEILGMDFISRSAVILSNYIGDEIPVALLEERIKLAFCFPLPLKKVSSNISCLELFHGPSLAFKDFGARFMAQMLSLINESNNRRITILTATSGDTGAAVAHAFLGIPNARVVILYPYGKITSLQEKLFCCFNANIRPVSIDGDFDLCQSLVKKAFDDEDLKNKVNLNSANSINITRILAQMCYYFEAVAQVSKKKRSNLVISVPSGNFGNLTAGLLAKTFGLPVKRFIAATNINDTVARYLATGKWKPNPTKSTLSNAMDVSYPNNWSRVKEIFRRKMWSLSDLGYGVVSDKIIRSTMSEIASMGYMIDPHSAVACHLLRDQLQKDEYGIFLGTAHPAKFKEIVEDVLKKEVILPKQLSVFSDLPSYSNRIGSDFSELKEILLEDFHI